MRQRKFTYPGLAPLNSRVFTLPISAPGNAVYEESFTADDGGFADPGLFTGAATAARSANAAHFNTAPAGLTIMFSDSADSGVWSPAFDASGIESVSCWIRNAGFQGGSLEIAIVECDANGDFLDSYQVASLPLVDVQTDYASFDEVSSGPITFLNGGVQARLMVYSTTGSFDSGGVALDTIAIEPTT